MGDPLYRIKLQPDDPWSVERHIEYLATVGVEVVLVEPADEFDATEVLTEEGRLSHVVWNTSTSRGEAMLPPGRYALAGIGGDE